MDMSKYSREDIIRMVEDEDVEFIRLQFTDIFGILKNVAITASQLDKALNNDCMFDGSAIEGLSLIHIFCKEGTVIVIYFIAVSVAFMDGFFAVKGVCPGIFIQNTWIRTKS